MFPTFIVGPARSGTSLMYRTLLSHPAFKGKKLSLEETGIFTRTFLALELAEGKDEKLYSYMLGNSLLYSSFVKSIEPVSRVQRLVSCVPRLPGLTTRSPRLWGLVGNSWVVRKYFTYAQKARGCSRIVEKTPIHLYFWKRIYQVYPHAYLIIMLRHPIVSSQ